jgi:membrane associated rhomboid family serine protease
VIVLPIRRGLRTAAVPFATLALVLVSTAVFVVSAIYDRSVLKAAAAYYVDSGLAAIELPHYREYLQMSTDADAVARLAYLERITAPATGRRVNAGALVQALNSDRAFDRDLHAFKVVLTSDPAYAQWQSERHQFEELTSAALEPRLDLSRHTWSEPWRLVTYLFVHPSPTVWLINLALLLLLGPFGEATAGAGRFLLCYLGGGAFGGAVNLLLGGQQPLGDWAALAALAGLLAAVFGTQSMHGKLAFSTRTVGLPGLAALALLIGVELLRWLLGARVDLPADMSGSLFGATLAGMLGLRGSRRYEALSATPQPVDTGAPKHSGLERQAHEAFRRLDTRRAKELYKELVDLEPQRIEHLCGYLNVAVLGPDETTLQDAALRLLWLRTRSHSDQVRKAFLQLTQPKVLKVLPIDEHLRLARRLVRLREDAAALKVLDAILSDSHLRQLYGRQLADCLLGIYTGYVRRRLTTLAETIRSRLTTYFEAPDDLGGLPPSSRPTTLLTSSQRRSPPTRS